MALRWLEGFENDQSAANWLSLKYDGSPNQLSPAAPGRYLGISATGTGASPRVFRPPAFSQQSDWVTGLAMGQFAAGGLVGYIRYLRAGVTQLELTITTSASDVVLSVFNGTTTWTVPARLVGGRWYYVEFVANIHPTTGSFSVWIDGVQKLSQTGVNTAQGGSANADNVEFAAVTSCRFDDIYILDNAAGGPTTRLGQIVIEGILPDSDGAELQWDTSGPNHWSVIDDSPTEGSVGIDRLTSDVIGQKFLVGYAALVHLVGNPTMRGIQVNNIAAMDGSGSLSFKTRFRDSGGSVSNGNTHAVSGTTANHFVQVWHQNPALAVAFTTTSVNAMQVGAEVV